MLKSPLTSVLKIFNNYLTKNSQSQCPRARKKSQVFLPKIKVMAPKMCLNVVDRAIQVHGGAGLNSDLPLAGFFAWARALRFADGPDEVHLRAIARGEISKYKLSK